MISKEKRVLIIDDDINCLQLFSIAVKRKGYFVTAVDKRDRILEESQKSGYDLLLIDLIIPELAVSNLIENFVSANPNSQVILITGYPEMISSIEFLTKKYIYEYLIKPVSPAKLTAIIDEYFKKLVI
ncbi:MAG: response regulator [Elusimicrobiota bacterium]